MRCLAKEYRPLVTKAREAGCHIERTRKGHLLFVTPTGARVIAPGTPSDRRALLNTTAQLRRSGVPV